MQLMSPAATTVLLLGKNVREGELVKIMLGIVDVKTGATITTVTEACKLYPYYPYGGEERN